MGAAAWVAFDELRRVARLRWVSVIVGAIWLTTLTATWVGQRSFADRQASHLAALQAKVEDQLRAKQPDGRTIDPGLRVLRASPVGLMLVEGSERHAPSAWDFGPAGPLPLSGYDNLRPQLGGLTSWDLSDVVTFLGSLAALAAGLASIWAHRVSGWVTAAARSAAPPAWQAVGQLVGGQLVMAAAAVIWLLAGLGSLFLLGATGLGELEEPLTGAVLEKSEAYSARS